MKKIIPIVTLVLFLSCSISDALAQDKKSVDIDGTLKESIYHKYKKEVWAFDKKDFDNLFFEFFQKQNDTNIKLTKEEFYTYTIKIAIYSEKYGMLYKDHKTEAQQTKKEWFDKKYSDYLESKK
ncbi:hypothetical protein [Flavobacterium sp.]|jgi:hypothetical protein|uniref:hypothetical protein n=1 Tax=Flavobacterium sp. TaxID=239 RepID=UPI0037BFD24A